MLTLLHFICLVYVYLALKYHFEATNVIKCTKLKKPIIEKTKIQKHIVSLPHSRHLHLSMLVFPFLRI